MIPVLAILYILLLPIPELNDLEISIASPEVKAAMKYHGILFAEMINSKEGYFYRNNKKCRLFTESFKIYYEKKILKDLQKI
jgi:hypothetical protein